MQQLKISKRFTQQDLNYLFKEASKYKVLTAEQEVTATREQLIKHNLLFVISIAKQYASGENDLKDFISEGLMGLIKAANNFDPTKGFKFSSYAVYKIRSEMFNYIYFKRKTIHIPQNVEIARNKLRKAPDNLTDDEMLKAAGITADVLKLIKLCPVLESMDATYSSSEDEYTKQFASDSSASDFCETNDTKKHLHNAIAKLSKREQEIIKFMYFSQYGQRPTLDSVAEQIGTISRERCRQLHKTALEKLKGYLL